MDWNKIIYSAVKPVDLWLSDRKAGRMLKVGDTAPNFKVKSHQGGWVSLGDFKGKSVVLWFFPRRILPAVASRVAHSAIARLSSRLAGRWCSGFRLTARNKTESSRRSFIFPSFSFAIPVAKSLWPTARVKRLATALRPVSATSSARMGASGTRSPRPMPRISRTSAALALARAIDAVNLL